MPLLEICVETPAAIVAARDHGADRLEVCAALALGGLTPSSGLVAFAVGSGLPVMAMIRPVAGDFVYDEDTLAIMADDIDRSAALGVAGVVFGILRRSTTLCDLDHDALARLVAHARAAGERRRRPLATTLHRAIDLCTDPVGAVDDAVAIGFDNILSSGGARTASDGAAMLAAMAVRAGDRCTIIAGAGIAPHNVEAIVASTRVGAVHASCTTDPAQPSERTGTGIDFGDAIRPIDIRQLIALHHAVDRSL